MANRSTETLRVVGESPIIPAAVAAALVFTYASMAIYWPIDSSPKEMAKMLGIPGAELAGAAAAAKLAVNVAGDVSRRINSLRAVPAREPEGGRR